MRLTPLDIRKQEFGSSLRGYDVGEVQAFLQMVSEQWQEQVEERRRLEEKVRDLKAKQAHYERVEEALQEALQTARENAQKAVEHAEREAEVLVKEAQAHAREVKQEAQEDRDRLRREATQLAGRRDELVARLRAFLTSELELLMRFDEEDPRALREAFAPRPTRRAPEAPEGSAAQGPEREPSRSPGAASEEGGEPPAAYAEVPDEDELPDFLERFSGEDETVPLERQDRPSEPSEEEAHDERAEAGWSVNALFAAKQGPPPPEHPPSSDRPGADEPSEERRAARDESASSSREMDKIRRILDDMD